MRPILKEQMPVESGLSKHVIPASLGTNMPYMPCPKLAQCKRYVFFHLQE
jgi:hypothetical protein